MANRRRSSHGEHMSIADQDKAAFGAIADRTPPASTDPVFNANARLARQRVTDLIAIGEPATAALYRIATEINRELAKFRPAHLSPGPAGSEFP